MEYSITTPERLRILCIKNDWFTDGSNEQYNKLFYANENLYLITEIATIIWICSNELWEKRDILGELVEARTEYLHMRSSNE